MHILLLTFALDWDQPYGESRPIIARICQQLFGPELGQKLPIFLLLQKRLPFCLGKAINQATGEKEKPLKASRNMLHMAANCTERKKETATYR